MKIIIVSLALILTGNCFAQNVQNHLSGKWITQEIDSYIMDFDSSNLLKFYALNMPVGMMCTIKHLSANEFSMTPLIEKRAFGPIGTGGFTSLRTPIDSLTTIQQYRIDKDTLFITNDAGQTTKAINCSTGICDFEKMFFRNSEVSVSLPVYKKDDVTTYKESAKAIEIFGGSYKITDFPTMSGLRYFWHEFQPLDEISIALLLSKHQAINDQTPEIILWIDKGTDMNLVAELLHVFHKNKVETVFFGIKKSNIVNMKFEPYLLPYKLENLDINDNLSFEKWLNQ